MELCCLWRSWRPCGSSGVKLQSPGSAWHGPVLVGRAEGGHALCFLVAGPVSPHQFLYWNSFPWEFLLSLYFPHLYYQGTPVCAEKGSLLYCTCKDLII